VVIPEKEIDPEEVADTLRVAYSRGKSHAIIVVAEGATYNAEKLVAFFDKHRERLGFAVRATILGHVQRGGDPGAFDRILASRLGAKAVTCIAKKEYGVLVGLLKGEVTTTPLEVVVKNKKKIDLNLFELARVLD